MWLSGIDIHWPTLAGQAVVLRGIPQYSIYSKYSVLGVPDLEKGLGNWSTANIEFGDKNGGRHGTSKTLILLYCLTSV